MARDNVIEAAHLFRREPSPTEEKSAFWKWGSEWVEDGILNLDAIVDDVKNSATEEELRRALIELRNEVETYPVDEEES